jgi:murein hydrolase activator
MMILRRPSHTDPRLVLGPALAIFLPLGADFAAFAQTPDVGLKGTLPPAAQSPSPVAPDAVKPDADVVKQHDQELDTARAAQRAAEENEAKLKSEIEALGADRSALNTQLIDTAARVRDVEGSIEATQERLHPLDERERLFTKSLAERRTAIVEILAALQRIGRNPPPALMVEPEDALKAVRTAITLGAVVPQMRAQADAIASDLTDLLRVRKDIDAERQKLSRDLAVLGREQLRLNMLINERQSKQTATQQALDAERQRATDLAHQVDSLKDLIAKLEASNVSANPAAHVASLAPEDTRPNLAALNDPGRLTPAVPFAAMRGRMRMPVNGVRVREFGAADAIGGTQKGISIAARSSAQITSPCDGWVVYAGPFRSYGQLLILNAGGGYHVLLAGMERISVDIGQFVLTGEPVAVMGGGSQVSASAATRSKQPVLYVEFRKDGTPIDPSPWWATNEGEKVRG